MALWCVSLNASVSLQEHIMFSVYEVHTIRLCTMVSHDCFLYRISAYASDDESTIV